MTLQAQETEIPLNLGMATKPSSELQEPTHMRLVQDLHWRGLGELERRPVDDAGHIVNTPTGSAYAETVSYGVVVRGDDPVVVTGQHGLATYWQTPNSLQWARPAVPASATPDAAMGYCPVNYDVSRMFVERAQFGKESSGLGTVAGAQHQGVQVIAWIEAGLDNKIWVKAIDRETGAVRATREYVISVNDYPDVQACEYTEPGKEGVLIAYMDVDVGAIANTVKTLRYDYATNAIVTDADLSADVTAGSYTVAKNGNRVLFAYEKFSTGMLTAEDRTVTAITSTHTGMHAADKAYALVNVNGRALIVSCTSTTVYAEVFGFPAGFITPLVASGETFRSVTAAIEDRVTTSNDAVVWVNSITTVAPTSTRVRSREVNFTANTPTVGSTAILPHSAAVAHGFTLQGRAHLALVVFSLGKYTYSAQPCFVARYRGHSNGKVRHDAVAKICHDRFFRAIDFQSSIDSCAYVDADDNAWLILTADPAEDAVKNTAMAPQTIFLERLAAKPPRPIAYASPEAGVVFSAGALPWEFDGDAPYEASALVRPMLVVDVSNAGDESEQQTGTFSAIAVYRWVDAAGRLHRMAGDAVSFTCIEKRIDLYVSLCPMRSFEPFSAIYTAYAFMEPEIYITGDQDSAAPDPKHYLANDADGNKLYYTGITTDALWYQFTAVNPDNTDAITLGIFTAAEVAPEPTPPFAHVTRIADRMWAVDAEDRARVWFSKPLLTGVGVEWAVQFTLTVGDEAVAVVDVGGIPTVLARGGIYQIGGPGPDATGLNGTFSPAVRLPYAVECLDPASVCRTPIGVVFRGRRGLYAFADAPRTEPGVLIDPEMLIDPALDPSASASYRLRVVYQEQTNEIQCVTPAGERLVFNTLEQKWSKYSGSAVITHDICVARGKLWRIVNVNSSANSTLLSEALYSAVGDAYNDSVGWRIDTPWYRLDQVNGQARLWRALFALRLASDPQDSQIVVTYYTDWAEFGGQSVTWTGAELAALLAAGDQVVRLPFVPAKQLCGAFKFRIESQELAASSMAKPLSMRLLFGQRPSKGKQSRAQVKG